MPDGVTKFPCLKHNTDPLTWFILGPSLFFAVFGTVQLLLFFSFSFFSLLNDHILSLRILVQFTTISLVKVENVISNRGIELNYKKTF